MIVETINSVPAINIVELRNFSKSNSIRLIGGIMEKSREEGKTVRQELLDSLSTMENNERSFYSSMLAMGFENSQMEKSKTCITVDAIKRISAKKVLK